MSTAAAPQLQPPVPSTSQEEAWDVFAEQNWERQATELKPFPGPALDPVRVFQMVSRWCQHHRPTWRTMMRESVPRNEGNRRSEKELSIQVRFLVDGWGPMRALRLAYQYLIPNKYFPRPEDGTFEGYYRRVKALINPGWRRALGLPPRRFALVLNNLEKFDPELFGWGRDCLRPLYRRVGMNNGGSFLVLFIGDYAKTAFGVHLDPDGVFHIPLVGPKAMRTWTEAYASTHPTLRGAMQYEEHLAASTFVRAEVGEAVYWPSPDWHIAESQGGLSVSVALSLNLSDSRFPWDDEDAPPPTGGVPRPKHKCFPFNPEDLDAAVAQVPSDLALTSEQDLNADQAREEWVGRATAMGFLNPTEPLDIPAPVETSRLVLVPGALLATVVLPGGERVVGANGHTLRTPHAAGAAALLAEVRSARPFEVGELLTRLSAQLPRAEGLAILHRLLRLRALRPA